MASPARTIAGRRGAARSPSPAIDTRRPARERIVAAAIELAGELDWDRVPYAAIAARAGVSRQTLYTQFPTRDALFDQVVEVAAAGIIGRVLDRAAGTTTGAEFVLDVMVSCILEFRDHPFTSTVALVRPDGVLGPDAVSIAMRCLQPLVDREPDLADDLEEVAETMMRFLLSLATFESDRTRSPEALRAYLRRRLLPALGLASHR
ncbi:MAG TPA: TetR/AcrR family transcriptional regulator [Acidimicrobiales bacterium]